MLSARACKTQHASDTTTNGAIRASFDKAPMLFPPGFRPDILHYFRFTRSPKRTTLDRNRGGTTMEKTDGTSQLDRRLFIAASAMTLLTASTAALAQQPQAPKASEAEAAKLTQLIAGFI